MFSSGLTLNLSLEPGSPGETLVRIPAFMLQIIALTNIAAELLVGFGAAAVFFIYLLAVLIVIIELLVPFLAVVHEGKWLFF